MGAMSNLMVQIQNEILRGELSFSQIAEAFNVPLRWVNEAADELVNSEFAHDEPEFAHDELERDHDEPYEPEFAEDAYLDASYEDRYDLGEFEY